MRVIGFLVVGLGGAVTTALIGAGVLDAPWWVFAGCVAAIAVMLGLAWWWDRRRGPGT